MGQGFSSNVVLQDNPIGPKSLMLLTYCNGSIVPVQFINFFSDSNEYSHQILYLIEPHGTLQQFETHYPCPKINLQSCITVMHNNYSISSEMVRGTKVWLFLPSMLTDFTKNEAMQIIKNSKFENYVSQTYFDPSSIFADAILPISPTMALKRSITAKRPITKKLTLAQTINSNRQISSTFMEFDDSCDCVCPGLYISGEKVSSDLALLREKNISHIINLNGGGSNNYFPNLFSYTTVNMSDHVFEELNQDFWNAIVNAEEHINQGQNVLVHCRMGISRSALFCAVYLIRQGFTFSEAIDTIKKQRPRIDINMGFVNQIKELNIEASHISHCL